MKLGTKLSEEVKKKISQKLKGRVAWNKGLTKEINSSIKIQGQKHSEKMKGRIPWNKGKTGIYTEETRKSISEKNKRKNLGELNPAKRIEVQEKISQSNAKHYAHGSARNKNYLKCFKVIRIILGTEDHHFHLIL